MNQMEARPGGTTNLENQAGSRLRKVLRRNREASIGGTYAVCSAHPAVIDAALEQASQDNSLLHIETTSSQVNQFGGYTHTTPMQFAEFIHSAAERAGLEPGQVLLGGDHLGPFPWRNEPSSTALKKACELVNQCVLAGYQKIHLDASMACADDPKTGVTEKTVAERAALLCRTAEEAFRELPAESPQCVYVVGTEVPTPGGESAEGQPPSVTTAEHANRTLEIFRAVFEEAGLTSAWQRVIALVVQPGVEFGSNNVFDYDPGKAQSLRSVLSQHPGIVFEAHSTDYQTQAALTRMVSDHFAILKVGPWLTFAYREAVLALSGIEQELLTSTSSRKPSNVRKALETVMMADPSQWKSYYHGSSEDIGRDLIYALSDRCRYYWNQPPVQAELARLFHNLRAITIPLTLLSQYLPFEYEVIRAGTIAPSPEGIIRFHIRRVLSAYAAACSLRESS